MAPQADITKAIEALNKGRAIVQFVKDALASGADAGAGAFECLDLATDALSVVANEMTALNARNKEPGESNVG